MVYDIYRIERRSVRGAKRRKERKGERNMVRIERKVRIVSIGDGAGWRAGCFCGCGRSSAPTDNYATAMKDRDRIIRAHHLSRTTRIKGRWCRDTGRYIICLSDGKAYYSEDGALWRDAAGSPADTSVFKVSAIELVGGPCHGDVIA